MRISRIIDGIKGNMFITATLFYLFVDVTGDEFFQRVCEECECHGVGRSAPDVYVNGNDDVELLLLQCRQLRRGASKHGIIHTTKPKKLK